MAFKIQNLSFRQLTKSVEVYLTAETGQFHQLIWFARMILVAENVSMCKFKKNIVLWKNTTSYILTSKAKGLKAAELSRNWQKIIIAQSSEWKLEEYFC